MANGNVHKKLETPGDSGDTGNSGNSGDTGNSGNTGNTGNTSDTGNTGDTGYEFPCEEAYKGFIKDCIDFKSMKVCNGKSWDEVSLTQVGFSWSCLDYYDGLDLIDTANSLTYSQAQNYCAKIGGRIPTISELRKLIINCPETQTGGTCKVTDSCVDFFECASGCTGCEFTGNNYYYSEYSVFGDTELLWSLSTAENAEDAKWIVSFSIAMVTIEAATNSNAVRCIKN